MNTRMLYLFLAFLFTSFSLNGQQTEKTLVKSFNLLGNQTVLFDIDAPIKVNTWNQDQMRVIMTITVETGHPMMIKSLVTAGRYNLNALQDGNRLKIVAPGLDRQIRLRNGGMFQEDITFEVFAPENVQVTSNYSKEDMTFNAN